MMKTMACTVLTVLAWASPALGEPPEYRSRIAPYINDETIAVVSVDLRRIDVNAAMDELLKSAPTLIQPDVQREIIPAVRQMANTIVDGLITHGCTHLCTLVSLADIGPGAGPLVIATVTDGGDVQAVAAILAGHPVDRPATRAADQPRSPRPFEVCRPVEQVVLAGSKATVQRAASLQPVARPDFDQAFAAVPDAVAAVAVSLGQDSRRVVREMFPWLPVPFQDLSGSLLADRVGWLAIGINLTPHLAVRGILQADDAATATILQRAAARGLQDVAAMPAVKQAVSNVDRLLPIVTPRLAGNRLAIDLGTKDQTIAQLAQIVVQSISAAQRAAQRQQSMNQLRQLALALHNYHDQHKSFPPAAVRNSQGKQLLSWRVLILPYLEQEGLFHEFHLDEPWDSEHNRKLIDKMPAAFAAPSEAPRQGMTRYLAPVGEKLAFTGGEGMPLKQFTDGTSNTILLVEAAPQQAVIWTRPDDLAVNLEQLPSTLMTSDRHGLLAAFADGSVQFLSEDLDAETLKALLTRNGSEPVSR